jgi:hypothetical protein
MLYIFYVKENLFSFQASNFLPFAQFAGSRGGGKKLSVYLINA